MQLQVDFKFIHALATITLLACSMGLTHMSVLAGVHASDDGADVACPVSLIEWFLNFYKESQKGPVQPLEGICRAGEVLFVPRGWWHMALNLEVGLTAAALVQCEVTTFCYCYCLSQVDGCHCCTRPSKQRLWAVPFLPNF